MRYFVKFPSGDEVEVDLQILPSGEIEVTAGGQKIAAEVLVEPPAGSAVAAPLALRVDGQIVDLWMEGAPPDVGVVARGQRFYAKVESDRDRALSAALGQKAAAGEGLVTSPMPGRVLKVLVAEGDVVEQGAPIVVVEAMKMENELAAPIDGVVRRVFASAGQTVDGGAKLVEIGPAMKRLELAHLPTPLQKPRGLDALVGADVWVKRDDMTAGPEAGNKIRKLEFLLADAKERGADVVVTCGGIQSNHARATALLAASLGMRAVLFLRTTAASLDPASAPFAGNVLLDRLVGAEIRLITPETYRDRTRVMAEAAHEIEAKGERAYVIPEGGSNGLGSLGYVEAMREVRAQLDAGSAEGKPFDAIVHACGSGGTAAGVALGASAHGVASQVIAMAVCDDAPTFERVIERISGEARALDTSLGAPAPLLVDDRSKGPAYAISTPEQRRAMIDVARASGLILDPVYTGKAFFGLMRLARDELRGRRVLFLHTGGLPGLLADGDAFRAEL